MKGKSLAGSSESRKRIEHDFYATPKETTQALLDNYSFKNFDCVLEPACGKGHVSEVLKQSNLFKTVLSTDLIYRGYYDQSATHNYLDVDKNYYSQFDAIITNPPFKLAQEFIEKSFELLVENGIIAMFLKIQFLEGIKRKKFFDENPPQEILVFSKRQIPLPNGKPWNSTMCFAWFIWKKGYKGDTKIKWI